MIKNYMASINNSKAFISAIVPVFNEEKTIESVVKRLIKHPLINEVICVNDGSQDKSSKILKLFKKEVKLINLRRNHGKGHALAEGVKKATGEIVTFFDADLTNLSSNHINSLLDPLIKNRARAVLGYPMGGHFPYLFKNVTGERAYYRKDLLKHLEMISKTTRFSTEYYLNSIFEEHEIKKLPLHGLIHLYKHEKYKPQQAIKETLKDILTITHQVGKEEGLLPNDFQFIKKFILNVRNANTLKELKEKINEVNNRNVKKYLKRVFVYFYQ